MSNGEKNSNKKTFKQTAVSPLSYSWVCHPSTSDILRYIKSNICIITSCRKEKQSKDEIVEDIEIANQANSSSNKHIKEHIVFGFNDILKSLKKNSVKLVVIAGNDENRAFLSNIPTACALCNPPVPFLALATDSGTLGRSVGIRSCTVFGFLSSSPSKLNDPSSLTQYNDILSHIITKYKCAPPKIPWILPSLSVSDIEGHLKALYQPLLLLRDKPKYTKLGIYKKKRKYDAECDNESSRLTKKQHTETSIE